MGKPYNDYRVVPLSAYKREKLRMLTQDFRIKMTDAEKAHLVELPDERSVDKYAREMFNRLH